MRQTVLSASSVHTYLECELEYWFTYIAMERGEQSLKALVGIAAHEAVEASLKADLAGKPENVEGVYHSALDRELRAGPVKVDRDETPAQARASGWAAVETYLGASYNSEWGEIPLAVEYEFEIEINGIGYSGSIDRVDPVVDERGDRVDNIVVVRDSKFPKSRPRKGRYRVPMLGYMTGYAVSEDATVQLGVLDHVVRTKTPYYWPEFMDAPTSDDIAELAATIEQVAEGIDKGRFRATGLDSRMACAMCPHTKACGPYQAAREDD